MERVLIVAKTHMNDGVCVGALILRTNRHNYLLEYGPSGRRNWSAGVLYIRYVGFPDPLPCIPAETLLRVSLARWWKPDWADDERCYLQLSGWYTCEERSEEDGL